ncbi:MAG: hypothetical protein FWB95_02785, partial [Treponema sp.]|nr:hypothetical protein [Treponema sp.]
MRDYQSLAEWLEAKGNPKHGIADGDNGNKVLAVESEYGMTLFSFKETTLPNDTKYFWISNGWGVNKEFFPAIKKFLNTPKSFYTTPEMSITEFDKPMEIDCSDEDDEDFGWIRKADKLEKNDTIDPCDCEDTFYAGGSVIVSDELFKDILNNISGPEYHFIKLLKEKNITKFFVKSNNSDCVLLCRTEGYTYLRYVQLVDIDCLPGEGE